MNIQNPNWALIRRIGESKILNMTMLIPFFGYMIIFNEQIVHLFEVSKDIFLHTIDATSTGNTGISNDAKMRLFYFYFGFTFLGIGSLTYQLLCPDLIKEYASNREFIREEISLMTPKRIQETIEHLKKNNSNDDELKDIIWRVERSGIESQQPVIDLMMMQWTHENKSTSIIRALTAIMYALGFIILSIPSIAMFTKVFNAFVA